MHRLLTLAALAVFVSQSHADVKIYRKTVPSTVLFLFQTEFSTSVGSGVLVDVERRLVLTVDHVVRNHARMGNFNVNVAFPAKGKNGRYITSATYYNKHPELRVPGKIIHVNRTKDLAIVQLDRLPAGAVAVPLATEEPDPGETVHVIGNSNYFEGGTFGYSEGKVRNLHYHDKPGFVFYSLTHHAPSNQGDSGGAVLDNDGKLLAVISQGTTGSQNRQVVDNSVYFTEIKRALQLVQQPAGNKLVFQGAVDSMGWDEFYFPVTRGATINMSLKGAGTCDLDLFADDVDFPVPQVLAFGKAKKVMGKIYLQKEGDIDDETGSFNADWNGYARAWVRDLGGKQGFKNKYKVTIEGFGLTSGSRRISSPLTAIRRIAAKGEDAYELRYEKGKGIARISIRGDGDTDLTLVVEDPSGKVVGQAKCREELVDVVWTPQLDGEYRAKVRNLGGIWNKYVLTTD